ncbi:hypothetical protein ACFL4X_01700 [Gemmatimonadota bacterium]
MNQQDLQRLMYEVHSQLDRNGLPVEIEWESRPTSRPDIEAIRLTIEREEKIYPLLSHA